MAINYTQTDTDYAAFGSATVNCGGGARTIFTNIGCVATNGGSAGSTPQSISHASSDTLVMRCPIKVVIASGINWNAGTWTWRLNITTANMNISLEEVCIKRVNSSDVIVADIGGTTGLGISLGTTGVKSGNITGSAQSPSVGDYVVVYFITTNSAMSGQAFSFTPNQNIDSPFDIPAAFIADSPFIINQAVKRSNTY